MKLKDMDIYKDAIKLAQLFRVFYTHLSNDDKFSIGSQMLRSSVSVASNIAEGIGRNGSGKSLVQFLGYAHGSLYEFDAQLDILCNDYTQLTGDMRSLIESLDDGITKMIKYSKTK